ncbi:GNAT family N-acetyltransferase [Fictibacillus halophilus]|uniref:GNAT family N-acetyltransferase n=1 Tax=Fictibacillus halophilus TaxID=1610490 RepID=UPI00363F984C
MQNTIICKVLSLNDLTDTFLSEFNRYQVTNQVLFKENHQYKMKSDHFIDDWDENKKAQVIHDLRICLDQGGRAIGAFDEAGLAGFANIDGCFFGSKMQYLELPYIHISSERRCSGIGKILFKKCCEEAKKLGAGKLYIAAHPSVESQEFYKAMGCDEAVEINDVILSREPLDIQLEKIL